MLSRRLRAARCAPAHILPAAAGSYLANECLAHVMRRWEGQSASLGCRGRQLVSGFNPGQAGWENRFMRWTCSPARRSLCYICVWCVRSGRQRCTGPAVDCQVRPQSHRPTRVSHRETRWRLHGRLALQLRPVCAGKSSLESACARKPVDPRDGDYRG